jgi:DnaJ family protein B protein 13
VKLIKISNNVPEIVHKCDLNVELIEMIRYRRLALQYNTERQQDTSLQPLFTLLGEAYEVLSSPLQRALYDQYGEVGMKKGLVTPYGWVEPYVYHGEPLRTYQ